MKIEIEYQGGVPSQSLSDFADKHGLVMEVRERSKGTALNGRTLPRFLASFKSVEVMERGCLSGVYGNGSTPNAAIADYATKLEGTRIAVDAYSKERCNIYVPNNLVVANED